MRSALFQEKVRSAPENALYRFSLGQALFDEGAAEKAIEHLRFCVASRSDWMLARILLAKALLQTDAPEAARKELELALRLAIEQKHESPEEEIRNLLAGLKA